MRYVFALVLLALAGTGHAQIYKWVDANGKTQFSDNPPPGARSEIIKVKPSSGAAAPAAPAGKTPTLAEREAALKQRRDEQASAEARAEDKARRDAEVAEYCRQMRGQLQTARNASRLMRYDENGKKQMLRGEDRTAEIQRIESELQKHCQK